MPKGHSQLETEVKKLRVDIYKDMYAYQDAATERIAALESRIAEMNEAFSRAAFPRAPQQSFRSSDGSEVPS